MSTQPPDIPVLHDMVTNPAEHVREAARTLLVDRADQNALFVLEQFVRQQERDRIYRAGVVNSDVLRREKQRDEKLAELRTSLSREEAQKANDDFWARNKAVDERLGEAAPLSKELQERRDYIEKHRAEADNAERQLYDQLVGQAQDAVSHLKALGWNATFNASFFAHRAKPGEDLPKLAPVDS